MSVQRAFLPRKHSCEQLEHVECAACPGGPGTIDCPTKNKTKKQKQKQKQQDNTHIVPITTEKQEQVYAKHSRTTTGLL